MSHSRNLRRNTCFFNYISQYLMFRQIFVLKAYLPVKQIGFLKEFSITDYLLIIKILTQKINKYNIPKHLVFVNFQKTFNTIETWVYFRITNGARIDTIYSKLLENIYDYATLQVVIVDFKKDIKSRRRYIVKTFYAIEDIFIILKKEE